MIAKGSKYDEGKTNFYFTLGNKHEIIYVYEREERHFYNYISQFRHPSDNPSTHFPRVFFIFCLHPYTSPKNLLFLLVITLDKAKLAGAVGIFFNVTHLDRQKIYNT